MLQVPAGAMLSAGFGRVRGNRLTDTLLDQLRDNETLALATAIYLQASSSGMPPHI